MSKHIKILVYPDDREMNPYMDLLYEPLSERASIKYVPFEYFGVITIGNLLLPINLLIRRLLGYRILHLHWLSYISAPKKKRYMMLMAQIYLLSFITLARIIGYRIVYTTHNLRPHERQFLNDKAVQKKILTASNTVIAHSESTAEDVRALLKDGTVNIKIVPHGSYYNYYTNIASDKYARRKLKINEDEYVFLFFGRVDEHKGIRELIGAFDLVYEKVNSVRLVIAGVCKDQNLSRYIKSSAEDLPIDFYNTFIPDDQVQEYMAAADAVVYPFREITTSGSVLLGITFGKPVIYPIIGDLKDLPKYVGYSFRPKEKDALCKAMLVAVKRTKLFDNKRSLTYAKKLSWENIAKTMLDIYLEVI